MDKIQERRFGEGLKGRMRVLFIISDLSGGGAERAVSTYLHHLDRTHFEPGLCIWRAEYAYDIPDDVPIWVMEKHRPWHAPRAVLRMSRLIKRWQPDVVVSFLAYVNLLSGLAINLCPNPPLWMPTVRNYPLNKNARLGNWLWTRMHSRSWQAIGTISKGISNVMCSDYGIPRNRIVNLYNPVDYSYIDASVAQQPNESPHPAGAIPTVITMGRLVEQKDQATLLRAIAIVKKSHDVRLVMLGEGPLRRRLESLACELGIGDAVDFMGFVRDPFPQVVAAELFVLSSRWEGFGKVLAEAMGCGTAVISTDCPYGPGEVIEDGTSGLLVPVGDPAALAKAIKQLLDNPQMREQLAAEGRSSSRARFNAEHCTRMLEEALYNMGSEK